jgi:hypothetical protein
MMKKRGYGERNPHQGLPQVDNHEIDRLELLAAVGETCAPKKMKKSLYYIAVLRTVWLPIFEKIKNFFGTTLQNAHSRMG